MNTIKYRVYRIKKENFTNELVGTTDTLKTAKMIAKTFQERGYDGSIEFKGILGWKKEKEFFANEEF